MQVGLTVNRVAGCLYCRGGFRHDPACGVSEARDLCDQQDPEANILQNQIRGGRRLEESVTGIRAEAKKLMGSERAVSFQIRIIRFKNQLLLGSVHLLLKVSPPYGFDFRGNDN